MLAAERTSKAFRATIGDRLARLALCFGLGAVLGTALDGIHAYGDVLAYPHPAFGRWAWFVPIEFGLLGLATGLVLPALERALAPDGAPHWPVSTRVAETTLFFCLYGLTALVDAALVLAIAFTALALGRLVLVRVEGDWAYALAAGVLGPAVEAALSGLGAFDYLEPDFAGIPYWLPPLWANGGLLIRRLIRPIVVPGNGEVRRVRRRAAGRS